MHDEFERRVRAAAMAGWSVVFVGFTLLIASWIAFQFVVRTHPTWMMTMWGPGADWPLVQTVWFWGLALFKIIVWLMAMGALWLTLWAKELKKSRGAS